MTRRNTSPPDPDVVSEALDRLAEELRVLRDVLDEIRSELQWANRNRREAGSPGWTARRITSMPLDPTAPDWAERLNRFSASDVVDEEPQPPAGEPGQLF